MPIVLVGLLLLGISEGLERWRSVIAFRIAPGGVVVVGVVALFVADKLTVSSAAALFIIGSLTGVLCVAPVLRNRRYRFDLALVRKAIPFGAKACASNTADLANARLDQLLMITLVSPRELGLYAVAVNLCSFGTLISGGMSPPLLARISAGEIELAPRALRMLLAVLALLTLMVAAVTPPLLELLFGPAFGDAAGATWVLLAAGLPLAGREILTQALNGVGRPGLPAVGQGVALLITVPGLLLLLPTMGIIGAAIVSLIAYTANFLILMVATMRICDMSVSELLVPTRSDVLWFRGFVRSRIRPSSSVA
jgi:O-antigen/teichoic acid export membrane protein